MGVADPLGFNIYLRKLRLDRGWSLRDVEKLTGGRVSNSYLSQIESGQIYNPSIITVHALSAAYAVNFEDLCLRALVGNEPLPPVPCCATCGRPFFAEGRADG
jgi:transcriptional regulator with XRE-family HTH domain